MSLIEEIGELSLVCAGQKAEIEELRELLRDANEMLSRWHAAMSTMYGKPAPERAPLLTMIEAWQARAQPLLEEGKP